MQQDIKIILAYGKGFKGVCEAFSEGMTHDLPKDDILYPEEEIVAVLVEKNPLLQDLIDKFDLTL